MSLGSHDTRSTRCSIVGVRWGGFVSIVVLFSLCLVPSGTSARKASQVVPVSVGLGGTRLVRFRSAITKTNVADPRIARTEGAQSRSLQVQGLSIGETTVTVWDSQSNLTRLVVSVGVPVEGLTVRIKALFPDESIEVRAAGHDIVLSGTVSDPVISDRVERLAGSFLLNRRSGRKAATRSSAKTGGKVLNFLSVKGRQQVQIRVKVAEVSRRALRQMGVNLWLRPDGHSGGILAPGSQLIADQENIIPKTTSVLGPTGDARLPQLIGPLGSAGAFGLHFATGGTSRTPISVAISLMQQHGLAKILSEPTLVAYSGQEAEFLSGGELPVVIGQGLGQVGVSYKKFGVQLGFTPTVLGHRTIHLAMAVTVSSLDRSVAAVTFGGTLIPGLTTRYGRTTVRLRNGQSFAIAGLLDDRVSSGSNKVPLLGDIPILGALFRQKTFDRQEVELVIMVQANLVRPLKAGEVPPLPGEDEVADPGALAFFLLGSVDPQLKGKVRSRPAGPVGYTK